MSRPRCRRSGPGGRDNKGWPKPALPRVQILISSPPHGAGSPVRAVEFRLSGHCLL